MEEVSLVAEAGRPTGTRSARRLRHTGKIPAVLYGHGIDPIPLAVESRSLRAALTTEAGANALITLRVDGDQHLAMARQLQRHPVRGTVDHVDFVIVRRDEVITAEVPVHLVGEATELHNADGVIDHQLFTLTVRAKPGDIPPAIEVDISGLTVGDTIRVENLSLPRDVTTDVDPETAVVVGAAPQVTVEEEVAAAEAEAAAEGEEAPAPGEAEGAAAPSEPAEGGEGAGGEGGEG